MSIRTRRRHRIRQRDAYLFMRLRYPRCGYRFGRWLFVVVILLRSLMRWSGERSSAAGACSRQFGPIQLWQTFMDSNVGREAHSTDATALLLEEEGQIIALPLGPLTVDGCIPEETDSDFRVMKADYRRQRPVRHETLKIVRPQGSDDELKRLQGQLRILQSQATRGGRGGSKLSSLDGVMAVATVQSVKYYGLFPASRLYRSFVLSSYSV
ncbi:hypothetical protein Tco_0327304 [Tanacetum coccineum]